MALSDAQHIESERWGNFATAVAVVTIVGVAWFLAAEGHWVVALFAYFAAVVVTLLQVARWVSIQPSRVIRPPEGPPGPPIRWASEYHTWQQQ